MSAPPSPAEGPAVLLRPLRAADVDALVAWGDDPAFCAAAEWRVRDAASRRAFWERQLAAPPADLLRLAAESEGVLVGYADLHGDEPDRRELGFLVGGPHWGRGVGTAIARAAIHHGFDAVGLDRIWAEAWEANEPSMRILRRLMRPSGPGEEGEYRGEPTRYARFAVDRQGRPG